MARVQRKRRLVRVIELGGDPIQKLTTAFIVLCVLAIASTILFVVLGTVFDSNLAYVIAAIIGFVIFYLIITSLADLVEAWGSRGVYQATQQATKAGFNPTWIAHSETWSGVVGVDEGKKQILINGLIFNYSDIRIVSERNEILLIEAGAVGTPAIVVPLDSIALAQETLARLCASLEMPLPTSSVVIT